MTSIHAPSGIEPSRQARTWSPYRWPRLLRIVGRVAVVGLSVAAAYAIWWVWCRSGAFGPRTLDITRYGDPFRVRWQNIVIVAALFSVAGWVVLAALERVNPSAARRRFAWLGFAVLLASFTPVVLEHASLATRLVLAGTHLAVAVPILTLMPRRVRVRSIPPADVRTS